MLANLTILENPFKTHDLTTTPLDIPLCGLPVAELDLPDGCDWLVAVNGELVGHDHVVQAGDCVAVSPKINKDYLGTILKIVVAIVAIWTGQVYGLYWALGVSVAGNLIVDAVVPAPTPDTPTLGTDPWNESPTYSWGQLQPTRGQGHPIPLLIGRHKVSGQELSKDITVAGDKQTLHILMGICGHEIDLIEDIRINDQPVSYYRSVLTETRLGTNNDDLIAGFGRLPAINSVNVRLTTVGHTAQTQGNAVEELSLDFSLSQGLYSMDDKGNIVGNSVEIEVEYRLVGDAAWTVYPVLPFSGASTNPLRRTVTITGLTPGQYEVQCRRVSAESTNVKVRDTIYWAGITEYILEPVQYNNIAKYAVSALATDQLSGGQPVLSCIASSLTTTVYNPYVLGYETVAKTNPAWAGYWLMHHVHGIPADRIDYDALKDFADYCDVQINGLPRHTVNLYLDSAADLWRNLTAIYQLGRAAPQKYGSIYSVIVNKPSTPVHLFSVAKMQAGSFTVTYSSSQDKANGIEITYIDASRDYTRQTIAAYSTDYNLPDTPDNKASMRLFGCTNEAEILRECAFRLNSTRWLIRSVSFIDDITAIPCRVGQLVYIQHDAPEWSDGGRIVSATADTVTFDKPLAVDGAKSYLCVCQLADDTLVERELVNPGTGEYATFTVATPFVALPELHNPYMFGASVDLKRIYRVTAIDRVSDLTSKIECAEYNEAIYTDSEYIFDLPEWNPEIQNAVAVNAAENITMESDGSYITHINVTWMPTFVASGYDWGVWIENLTSGDEPVMVGQTPSLHYTIPSDAILTGNQYRVYVSRYNAGPVDSGENTTTFTVLREFAPPSDVLAFVGTYNPITRTVIFSWSGVDDLDLDHYEIREGGTDWDTATVIADNVNGSGYSHYIDDATLATITYRIKAVDRAEQYSLTATTSAVAVDTSKTNLVTPTGLTLTTGSNIADDGTDQVYIRATWDANSEISDEWSHYDLEIETALGWPSAVITQKTEYTFDVVANATYTVRLRAADRAGNDSAWTELIIVSAKDNTPPERVTWPGLSSDIVPGFKLIGLNWTQSAAQDIRGYIIQRSIDLAFTIPVDLGEVAANYFVDTQLAVSTEYFYRVKAVDRSGNQSALWSIIVSTTTLQVGETDIAANSVTANMVKAGEIFTNNLQSANYVADTDGYNLNAIAGTAEFNNIQMVLNWGADVTGIDIPAAGATVGATWGVDIGGTNLPADNADVTDYTDYRVTNNSVENSVLTIAKPVGGSLAVNSIGVTGAIVITLPQSWTNTMMKMVIDIYLYSGSASFSVAVGGYNYAGSPAWVNTFAQLFGNTGSNNRVRFGHDGSNCCIVIGDIASVWEYPNITVKDFQAGFSNYTEAQWATGWSVAIKDDLTGYTFTSDIADSLIDAKSILGQGALATQNRSDLDYTDGATVGAIWGVDITGQPSNTQLLNNLIDPSVWVVGSTGSQGSFVTYGAVNEIVLGEGPHGGTEPIWVGTPTTDGVLQDGGFQLFDLPVDSTKTYRFTYFVKVEYDSVLANVYLRVIASAGEVLTLSGGDVAYADCFIGDLPEIDKWYMVVGIVHGEGYSGSTVSTIAGVYDLTTGARVVAGTDFKFAVGLPTLGLSVFQYNAQNALRKIHITRPRFELLNDSSPTILQLLGAADVTQGALDSGLDTETGGLIVRNSTTLDYAHLTAGDLNFYYSDGLGGFNLYQSVNRLETNPAPVLNGTTVALPGIWKQQPKIQVTARDIVYYNKNYPNQDQRVQCFAENITEDPIGSKKYKFDAVARATLGAGQAVIATAESTTYSTWYDFGVESTLWGKPPILDFTQTLEASFDFKYISTGGGNVYNMNFIARFKVGVNGGALVERASVAARTYLAAAYTKTFFFDAGADTITSYQITIKSDSLIEIPSYYSAVNEVNFYDAACTLSGATIIANGYLDYTAQGQ